MLHVRHVLIAACLVGLLTCQAQARSLYATGEGEDTMLLTVLHINDVHARYQPATSSFGPCDLENFAACYGGYARLQTAADRIRNTSDHDVIFLDAGDQFSGTLWDTLYKGQLAATFQNQLGVQAQTVGNHDCDFGPDLLANHTLNVNFPILGANINASAHPVLGSTIQPYTIITLSNGIEVGVVGFATETTAVTSSCGSEVQFVPPEDVLPAVLAELKAQGIEHIIGLSHAGYDMDLKLAAMPELQELDLIVGGHTHTFLYTDDPPELQKDSNKTDTPSGLYPTLVKNGDKTIPIVQAYWAGRYLGNLQTEWSLDGDLLNFTGQPILMGGANSTSFIPADPVVVDLIDDYEGPVLAANKQVVGSSTEDLEGDPYVIRRYETNLGNLVAGAAYEHAMSQLSEYAEQGIPAVAMINAGSIRQSIPKGNITLAEISTTMPYGNWVVVKQLTGEEVVATLEHAVSDLEHPAGRFVQVANISYSYDENQPVGSRIVQAVLPNNQSVAEVPEVLAIVTNYMSDGGDGFDVLKDLPVILDTSAPLEQVTEEFLQAHSPVSPGTQGRIAVCANGPNTNATNAESPLCQ